MAIVGTCYALKTEAKLREIYGGLLPWIAGAVQEHWGYVAFGIVAGIASIVGLALAL